MKVDVIVIGSGIAGLAIAAALGRQKLKALVIGPDISASNFDFEYIFENSTITNLPAVASFDAIGFSGTKKTSIDKTLLCVDSKSLYQRFLMSCADNGVGMMHGRAEKVVSYRKLHRVDWVPNQIGDTQLPKEELFAALVIDASGALSPFSEKPTGFTSTYRKIFRGKGDLFGKDLSLFDFSQTDDQDSSFCRGFRHEDGRYFVDEINLYSRLPVSEEQLSQRLLKRLEAGKFTIEEECQNTYHYTPLFSNHRSGKILAFGDAAAMANPITGEATSRVVNTAPGLAKLIAESINKSPKEIVNLGRETLFSDAEKRREDTLKFLAENIFLSSSKQQKFIEALFSAPGILDSFVFGNKINTAAYGILESLIETLCTEDAFKKFVGFNLS